MLFRLLFGHVDLDCVITREALCHGSCCPPVRGLDLAYDPANLRNALLRPRIGLVSVLPILQSAVDNFYQC